VSKDKAIINMPMKSPNKIPISKQGFGGFNIANCHKENNPVSVRSSMSGQSSGQVDNLSVSIHPQMINAPNFVKSSSHAKNGTGQAY
jgi:hypothetical protein